MSGYTFEVAELAWLLAVVNANGIAGVDDPRFLPSTLAEREATYNTGLTSLKARGWLVPADRVDSFHVDDTLAQLVLSLAEPTYAIRTAIDDAGMGPGKSTGNDPKAVLHYIAPSGIAELSAEPDGRYTLGAVLTISALVERLVDFLSGQADQDLGAANRPDASELAKFAELSGPHGEIIVARTRRNTLLDAHQAKVHAGAWLTSQASPGTTVTVTPLSTTALETWLDEFMQTTSA